MNRREFQNLALQRLADAQALFDAKRYAGSYYLAGYAIECALKARIARQTKQHDFPPRDAAKHYTHDITKLLDSSGLAAKFKAEADNNPNFRANWTLVKDWTEEARYQTRRRLEAEALLTAVTDSQSGVLRWLRKYW